jgi:hypothetical protein
VTGQNDRSIRESFSLGNEVDLWYQHRDYYDWQLFDLQRPFGIHQLPC